MVFNIDCQQAQAILLIVKTSVCPHGGNDYKPSGVKVVKFVLTGNDWLDPSTVKFQLQVNNTATATTTGTIKMPA